MTELTEVTSGSGVEPNKKTIYDYECEERAHFVDLLKLNPGGIILKFEADWCRPCQTIKGYATEMFEKTGDKIMCVNVNVDNSIDLYAYLKRMKVVKGIPVFLAYYRDNTTFFPNHSISGTDKAEIELFFKTVEKAVHILDT
tara:strand:- start:1134 stop:1559 length:426 start_codon:yes stop_codon:yes gene_type:complete